MLGDVGAQNQLEGAFWGMGKERWPLLVGVWGAPGLRVPIALQ